MTTRVRSILSRLDASAKKRFVKIMPVMAIPPECLVSVLYPHSLLSQLPKESCYLLLDYLKAAHETGLLRLIHFNDSATTCGACVDRHAYIGTGHIGLEKMAQLGAFGAEIGVDMVVE